MKEIRRNTFTNGFVAALELEDGKRIETTATCLPISTEMRGVVGKTSNEATDYNNFEEGHWKEKFMIGVSTQSGCSFHCKFCAVNKLTDKQGFRNLTVKEILDQVEWAIGQSGRKPEDAQIFRVLFTRMGDSSMNIDNVVEACYLLKWKYKHVRIQISTIGVRKQSLKLIEDLAHMQAIFGEQFIELQFSVHSTDYEFRKWLQHNSIMNNYDISGLIKHYVGLLHYYRIDVKWKVTLNFALAENTPFDPKELVDQFDPEDVFIKISPINENVVSDANGLKTKFININVI